MPNTNRATSTPSPARKAAEQIAHRTPSWEALDRDIEKDNLERIISSCYAERESEYQTLAESYDRIVKEAVALNRAKAEREKAIGELLAAWDQLYILLPQSKDADCGCSTCKMRRAAEVLRSRM